MNRVTCVSEGRQHGINNQLFILSLRNHFQIFALRSKKEKFSYSAWFSESIERAYTNVMMQNHSTNTWISADSFCIHLINSIQGIKSCWAKHWGYFVKALTHSKTFFLFFFLLDSRVYQVSFIGYTFFPHKAYWIRQINQWFYVDAQRLRLNILGVWINTLHWDIKDVRCSEKREFFVRSLQEKLPFIFKRGKCDSLLFLYKKLSWNYRNFDFYRFFFSSLFLVNFQEFFQFLRKFW